MDKSRVWFISDKWLKQRKKKRKKTLQKPTKICAKYRYTLASSEMIGLTELLVNELLAVCWLIIIMIISIKPGLVFYPNVKNIYLLVRFKLKSISEMNCSSFFEEHS